MVCVGQLLLIAGDPVLLRVFLLVSSLTWRWRILLGLVLNGTLLVRSNGEDGVGSRMGFLLLAVPMRWLRPMLALLLIGGSRLTFR